MMHETQHQTYGKPYALRLGALRRGSGPPPPPCNPQGSSAIDLCVTGFEATGVCQASGSAATQCEGAGNGVPE